MKNKFHYSDGTSSEKRNPYKDLHREDGPAAEYSNGDKIWFLNDYYHRIGNPAVERSDGSKAWWVNGSLHRLDGPAVENNPKVGYWYTNGWFVEGKKHRIDGPAIESLEKNEWWINDVKLRIIPKYVLINYMKAYNFTVAHLLTDSDLLVRKSMRKYKWK